MLNTQPQDTGLMPTNIRALLVENLNFGLNRLRHLFTSRWRDGNPRVRAEMRKALTEDQIHLFGHLDQYDTLHDTIALIRELAGYLSIDLSTHHISDYDYDLVRVDGRIEEVQVDWGQVVTEAERLLREIPHWKPTPKRRSTKAA